MPAVRSKAELQTQKTKVRCPGELYEWHKHEDTKTASHADAVDLAYRFLPCVVGASDSFPGPETINTDTVFREFSSKELRTVGNYALGRLIGKGSFGKVYLASHKLTNGSKVLQLGELNQTEG